ncbi:Sua5/YciO/YrdC/YwlC family protein [Chlorobaculum parvum NCIB 8327]|uniref:Threonylcarbamoyl-AMP synthase n=1 Tax=Chlorobaculum parvum (strain DSM 263 / NCIMB 8327) TaxID=517417 RepID=B3QLK9_CHLP8|nr:L-threonylcarbamoyladenylate synthase [Chlorobaculum parvum]ACF10899.1 Sua5/YciO/YrdC/YwlC family protein [Chlorobaculum parvum NCIB 8327]
MQTLVTDKPEEAASHLNRGETVAFPTETVYGLGADAFNPDAVAGIFRAKGRPSDNPLIVHVASPDRVGEVAREINEAAQRLIERYFPGPLTIVLKKRDSVPDIVSAGLPTVGVRCPAHSQAAEFLRHCKHPVAAPSANVSGRPSPTDWKTVYHDLGGKIACLLRGEPSTIGLESTIVDCSVKPPLLLRSGAISLEALQEIVPDIKVATTCREGEAPKSPGQKYRHYSPEAEIILVETAPSSLPTEQKAAWIGLSTPPAGATKSLQCHDLDEYARVLFGFFRTCDAEGIRTIYCELPPEEGIGRAIRDRLVKAAG